MTARRRAALAFLLLAAWALGLRLWYASGDLAYRRSFDERFALDNASQVMDGDWRPVTGWYPSLAHLPHAAVLAAAERIAAAAGRPELIRSQRRFMPAGFLIARTVQVLAGLLGLWLLYRIGRRWDGAPLGLLAAALLAGSPLHVKMSGFVKPDILMLAAVLAVFLLAARLRERPVWRRHLAAGAGIGLILATKQSGAPGALPALVAGVAAARRPRDLLRPVAALALGVAVFVALNPYVTLLIEAARRNVALYAYRGDTRLDVLGAALASPLSPLFLGPVAGSLGLAGLVWCAITAVRRRGGGSAERWTPGLVVATWAGFVAFTAAIFTWDKPILYLPFQPFVALAAAFLLVRLHRAAAARHRAAAWVVAAACLALVAWRQVEALRWTYSVRVPSTYERVGEYLASALPEPLAGRMVVFEPAGAGHWLRPVERRRQWAVVRRASSLRRVGHVRLDLADAEVFPVSRLDGERGDFYRRRLERAPPHLAFVLEPRLFRSRGEPVMVLYHPWRLVPPPRRLELVQTAAASGLYEATLPAAAAGDRRLWLSVRLWVPRSPAEPAGQPLPELRLAGRQVPLESQRLFDDGQLVLSRRTRAPRRSGGVTLRLAASPEEGPRPESLEAHLELWLLPKRGGSGP